MRILSRTILASAIIGMTAVPAAAQIQAANLVNVNVSNIRVELEDVIADNNINAQIPVNAIVQVPIGLAANVCGTTVALLSAAGSAAGCNAEAENTTRGEAMAIARALQRQ